MEAASAVLTAHATPATASEVEMKLEAEIALSPSAAGIIIVK